MSISIPYRYSVTLRITHPELLPQLVTSELGLEPHRSWGVGEPRSTPTGSPLPGVRKDSFWSYQFVTPTDGELEQFLLSVVASLSAHADYFQHISSSGGRSELFVGFFMQSRNTGVVLSPQLQEACSALALAVALDIYAQEPGP